MPDCGSAILGAINLLERNKMILFFMFCFSVCSWGEMYNIVNYKKFWAAAWQNQHDDLCAQRRIRSAWASAQTDQGLRYQHDTLSPKLPTERTAKTPIRLGWLPGWSESSLGALVIFLVLVLSCCGSNCFFCSSSWYQNRAASFDCGTPWRFLPWFLV